MSTEVTPESLRAHAEQATGTMRRALYAWADSVERERILADPRPDGAA